MVKFGKWIAKHRILILIVGVLLLIPSAIGMIKTRVNYDILSYLPEDIETMKGQDILMDDFGKGGFSMVMIQGMSDKEVAATKEKIEAVDHVADVVWYDTIADISIPKEVLPDDIYEFFNSDDSTLMAVFFDDTTAGDGTLGAIEQIRKIAGKQCFVSGMSAVNLDIKNLSEKESVMYVVIAVLLVSLVLAVTMESYLMPVFMMISIGMAILYNMGTNFFLGEISFITKALSAVLQLGVTMDFSIFLWHSYQENQERFPGDKNRAMGHAISNTISSVVGSSLTTVAGFLALCFMSFTLGIDLGIVMAKGVVIGVIGCVTILPSLILTFDKVIEKTRHRDIIPSLDRVASFIVKRWWVFLILFAVALAPAIYGYTHYDVYYNFDTMLPDDSESVIANTKLSEEFNMNSTHMLLVDADMSSKDVNSMMNEINNTDGVSFALGLDTLIGSAIPQEIIPESVTSILKSGDWQLMLIGSEYKTASDNVNNQITEINNIIKKYDENAMLVGEAPATKDLISIMDTDFKMVSTVSIGVIFILIAIVLKSISLPVILVAVIEFAIFVNMGIPAYTGSVLPFIASIVIGTIQLGATVDYAILMTTRYKKERSKGKTKKESVYIALSTSMKSIIVSAMGFFAATVGVGLYSEMDMISSLCILMARGAIVSMFTVILVLPSMFMLFDKLICRTTIGIRPKKA
ncbi:efflux RND transporter permease subunit [Porcipelethomonas sp.]|uniref:efflux RND transporter permease subunit n=1 Tax=Porcipelethomonas sp. TaxID=2981675 RepID=UPI003EFA2908